MADKSEMEVPLSVESIFFMSDSDLLKVKTDQSEIDMAVKEIWDTYFATHMKEKLLLDEIQFAQLHERYEKGGPFEKEIFDPIAHNIFNYALKVGEFPKRVRYFATATVYKKRVSGIPAHPPDELFDELTELVNNDKLWKPIKHKPQHNYRVERNIDPSFGAYTGINWRERVNIRCSLDSLFNYLWDPSKVAEWNNVDVSVIEKIGDRCQVWHSKYKAMTGLTEFIQWVGKKVMPDGTIYLVYTSVDHHAAPIGKIKRSQMPLMVHRMKKVDEETCEAMCWCVFSLKDQPIAHLIMKNDWAMIKSLSRVKIVKKMVEEGHNKK